MAKTVPKPGAVAPIDEIEITPAMIEAGVRKLEDGLIDGFSIARFRADLVRDIYLAMRAQLHFVREPLTKI